MIALQEVTSLTLTPHLTRAPAHTVQCSLNTVKARAFMPLGLSRDVLMFRCFSSWKRLCTVFWDIAIWRKVKS